MKTCYVYTNDGFYAGEQNAYRRLPGNATFSPPPPRPWVKVWPKMVDGDWQMVQDHRERPAHLFPDDPQEATEFWLPDDTWETPPRKMTKPGPLPEGAILTRPEKPAATLDEAKAEAVVKVDEATSAAILAGFDYQINGQALHFSYDSFDQQNFADSANVASRALSGEAGLPQSVTWNAYQNGSLVRLDLGPADFLALYTKGALGHKASCMEAGGQKKAAIAATQSADEVHGLLEAWGI